MALNIPTTKPFEDPIFSTNRTEVHDRGYDCFMFAWDIYRDKPSEHIDQNLKELGPLSIALTDNENIDRIVDDFVPYNVNFVKFLSFTPEGERETKNFSLLDERYEILRSGLKKIFKACLEGVFDHELEDDVPEDRRHFSILFNIFVTPIEAGRTIFDIKEINEDGFPTYNESFSLFGHYALITYKKGEEKEFDIKPIDLSSIGLDKTFF